MTDDKDARLLNLVGAKLKVIVATRRDLWGDPTGFIETTVEARDHWRFDVWRSRP